MSNSMVDSRTVEMRFDNSNFEKNVKQSMSTLDKLKRALKLDGASAGLKEVEKTSRGLKFQDLNRSVDDVGKRFSVLETIATGALLKIGASAAETGMKLAKSLTVDQLASGWSKYAEKTTAVQTIMSNLRDDEGAFVDEASKLEHVNHYLDKLLWFSDETSYSFTDMTSNVGKFIANGQGLEESVTAMQGIATWAALAGQNSQVASRAMYNISQAMGTGYMQVKDWASIENANMATSQFKELAIAIGEKQGKIKEGTVTIENFRDSLSSKGKGKKNGWFDKDVMMEVFETYGEAANRIQEYAESHQITSTEAIKEIKKTDAEFADSVGFKAFAAAQEAKTFQDVISATADAVSTKWMRIFETIFGNYLEAKELWTDLSEQMWEIFAAPLDTLNDIMSMWNRGFFKDGPKNIVEQWFEGGQLDVLGNDLSVVSMETAKMAVANDSAVYSIIELEGGIKKLQARIKDENGVYQLYTKDIYEADESLLSGRELLLESFQNVFDTVIHDVEDENGNLESMSFFGALKRGLLETIFGTSELGELVPVVSRKIWEFSKRVTELTEKLKPSMETSLKIKNVFKGLFTVFKIGAKLISAIIKPFTTLFKDTFSEAPKGILDFADSLSSWIQSLDEFLDKNKVFDVISEKISNGINKMKESANDFSVALTGLTIDELLSSIKEKLYGLFGNNDFESAYDSVTTFFSGLKEEVEQVKTGNLPEVLTPFQKFLTRWKKITDGIKSLFYASDENGNKLAMTSIIEQIKQVKSGDLPEYLSPFQSFLLKAQTIFGYLKSVFLKISGLITQIKQVKSGDLPEALTPFQKFIIKGQTVFNGIKKFLGSVWPIISNIAGNIKESIETKDFKSLFTNVWDTLKSLYEKIQDSGFVGTVVDTLGSVFTSLFSVVSYITDSLSSGNTSGIFKAVGIIIALVLIANLVNSFIAVWIIGRKAGWILDGFYEIMRGIGDFFHSKAFEAKGNAAKSFATAILLLVAAVAALGGMDVNTLAQGVLGVGLLVGVIWLFKKIVGSSKTFALAAVSLLAFSVAIGLLTGVVAILGKMNSKRVYQGVIAMAAMVLVFGLFSKLVGKLIGINLISVTAAFVLFAIAIDVMAVGVKALGKLSVGELAKGLIAVGVLVAIFGLLRLLTKNLVGLNFILVLASFTIFAIAIDVMAVGVKALGKLSVGELAKGLIAIGVLVAIFGLLRLLTKNLVGLNFILVLTSFVIFAAAIDAMAVGVKTLGKMSVGELAKGLIAIGLLVIIFGVLRVLTTLVNGLNLVLILTSFTIFAAAIDVMAIGVKALGKLSVGELAKGLIAIGLLVIIFGILRVLTTLVNGLNLVLILTSFTIFAVAIDVMAVGVKALGKLSVGELAKGLIAIGLLIGMYKLLTSAKLKTSFGSVKGFIAFAAAILVVAVSLNILVPVMKQIDAMGDGWWKPIVFLAGAIVILLAAGAIAGLGLVSAGLIVLSVAVLAIGAACLIAGVGIGVASSGLALFAQTIATYGTQAAENIGLFVDALLDTLIASCPKIAVAGAALIIALATGIAAAAGSIVAAAITIIVTFVLTLLQTIVDLMPSVSKGFIDAINALADCIRDSAPLMVQAMSNLMESLVESALVGLAGLVKPFGDVGKKLSEKITKWIPKLRDAFGVVQDESANAGKEASDAFDYEFSGGGAGKSFSAKDVNVDDLYDKYIGKTNDKKQNNQSSGSDSSGFDISSMLTQLGNGGLSIPGVSGGVGNFADMLGIKSMDFSSFTDMFNSGFEGMDFSGIMSGKITDMTTTMNDSGDTVSASATDMAANVEKPIKSLDSKKWGQDLGDNLSKGLLDKIPQVKAAASKLAEVIHEILGFSEPEKGPLSDFHTYAPDMIKLWNKGIYDNLGTVRASTTDVADTMYDGFSDALGYVSDLIDNGMSDDLTIRPVMDLSEIQNGIDSMDGMLSKADGYSIRGTARLAATAAYGMSAGQTASNADAKIINADVGPTNNAFYIYNSDPNSVAEKVSKILGSQARRQKAVWAHK